MNNASSQDLISATYQRNPMDGENKKYQVKRVCCYCQADMGTKPCDAASDGKITHGVCNACFAIEIQMIRENK